MSQSSFVGRKLGGFIVERELGRGGMGIVVLARQQSLDRPAVLKRIHAELASHHPELEARFEREAIAAARLHHPNVVTVYDRFQHRGAHYLATEFVDGVDLSKVLEHEGRLPWRIAATIALEIARGLEAIHSEGTLHRDLKPQNLLIGRRGEVKIADFGLALDSSSGMALTQPGVAVGTPPYMPPEQLRGERVDSRADLFAFGCLLYEMLKGETPYAMPQDREPEPAGKSLLARVESGRYTRIRSHQREIPRALARLVRRCIAPRLTRRISTATEIRRKLETILDKPPRGECQSRLAAFLWERQLFERRETETVVMVACQEGALKHRGLRFSLAAVTLVISILTLGLSIRYPGEVAGWTQTLTTHIEPIGIRLANELAPDY